MTRTALRAIAAGSLAAFLSGAAFSAPLDCEKLKVSVLPEPPGYAAQCLGITAPARKSVSPSAPLGLNIGYFLNLLSGGTYGQSFLSAPFPSFVFTNLGPQTLQIFAMDSDAAGTMFGIDNASRNLGTINLGTGAFTPTVQVTGVAGDTITGMAIEPTTGTFYISVTDGSPVTAASLYTLNTGTGAATLVGPIAATGAPPAVVGIAISNFGDLYAHDVGGDRILKIDKTTAAVEEIGATGFDANFAQGMDFDAATDTLHLALYEATGAQHLTSVDLQTGSATIVASTPFPVQLEFACANDPPVSPQQQAIPVEAYIDGSGRTSLRIDVVSYFSGGWKNVGRTPIPAGTGNAVAFGGPPGPTYNLIDNTADYPEMTPGGMTTTFGGYTIRVDAVTRPAQHFDATLVEVLPQAGGVLRPWGIHVGGSFSDVPTSSPFYPFVETLFHKEITAGCGPNIYCPTRIITRGEMAVFLVRGKFPNASPTPCSPPNTFADVPETSPYCRWIEELARQEVTAGCGNGNYCPDADVLREQMAVFLLRTRFGRGYVPPDPFPTVTFEDVQPGSPFYTYIEIAHQRGYTAGCATNPLRYCPQQPVTREQMPVFILTALDPPLPTFTPAPTATPMAPSVGATTSPGGGGLMGLLLLALGFGSAIALPIALSAKRQPAEETGRT